MIRWRTALALVAIAMGCKRKSPPLTASPVTDPSFSTSAPKPSIELRPIVIGHSVWLLDVAGEAFLNSGDQIAHLEGPTIHPLAPLPASPPMTAFARLEGGWPDHLVATYSHSDPGPVGGPNTFFRWDGHAWAIDPAISGWHRTVEQWGDGRLLELFDAPGAPPMRWLATTDASTALPSVDLSTLPGCVVAPGTRFYDASSMSGWTLVLVELLCPKPTWRNMVWAPNESVGVPIAELPTEGRHASYTLTQGGLVFAAIVTIDGTHARTEMFQLSGGAWAKVAAPNGFLRYHAVTTSGQRWAIASVPDEWGNYGADYLWRFDPTLGWTEVALPLKDLDLGPFKPEWARPQANGAAHAGKPLMMYTLVVHGDDVYVGTTGTERDVVFHNGGTLQTF